MKKLTDKQNEVVRFIIRFKNENDYSPTFRDIANHFKISSKAASDHIKLIEKKGYISLTPGKARSIVVNI